jgi:hypothetical protein
MAGTGLVVLARRIVRYARRRIAAVARIARVVVTKPGPLYDEVKAAVLRVVQPPAYIQYVNGLPNVCPLNLEVDPALEKTPRLNVLIPGMAMRAMSGGPNTAINLAYRMAQRGVPVRFISTDIPMERDEALLWQHFTALTGIRERLVNVEIRCGHDRTRPLPIGANDVFFGTAWWTVQMIKRALPLVHSQRFLYLIQEFEPGLYSWSTRHALALETYHLPFFGLINERLVADYLAEQRIGQFADPSFVTKSCAIFEPAIDREKFHSSPRPGRGPRRLLFYARPLNAERNLFELGLYALQTAAIQGVFSGEAWEMFFIGEDVPDVVLSPAITVRSTRWLGYDDYAALIRGSDIALSLMLSPHTSYPPLEIAAAGGIAVTNTYSVKTAARLAQISPNIVAVEPTLEGVVAGLEEAISRVRAGAREASGVNLPGSWEESFADVLPRAISMYEQCVAAPGALRASQTA